MADDDLVLDTGQIRDWRSIVTFIVFIVTNIIVLFPFHVPVFVPRILWNPLLQSLARFRVIDAKHGSLQHEADATDAHRGKFWSFVHKHFKVLSFPYNFVTAPLIADLFLLAILAIGRDEVLHGTIGANHISPIDILLFFLTLAYIAISIDASGLIRFLAFKVLQWGGSVGHRLFFYLYAFFFGLGSFIGNDPIILSGTAFLAYMTRASSNIRHPRAWIYTQFAVANIASAILVSSNPTNLVLAGAFQIKFIHYTANMIVPVVITAILLFPFLLYIVFADEKLIPQSITMHELPKGVTDRPPVNPNIPRNTTEEEEKKLANSEEGKVLSLEEIMHPFLDKRGAAFGAFIIAATLITILAINAANTTSKEMHVFWVTLPAAFVMFCWDIQYGWRHRKETREIARHGRPQAKRDVDEEKKGEVDGEESKTNDKDTQVPEQAFVTGVEQTQTGEEKTRSFSSVTSEESDERKSETNEKQLELSGATLGNELAPRKTDEKHQLEGTKSELPDMPLRRETTGLQSDLDEKIQDQNTNQDKEQHERSSSKPQTLVSLVAEKYRWLQETFPTATAVLAHLPFALVPFSFAMFVLVEALVTKGWVPVFAHGWDHWVQKTGTIGAIGGMGFLSVILCNFAGTNIGTTILLSRVIQAWQEIHRSNHTDISDRTFWATVYSMALGVNYGAFSMAFSGSLAGLLWRDILGRKHIHVRRIEFARENLPIIAIAMTVGCSVLVGEVYLFRDNKPYSLG